MISVISVCSVVYKQFFYEFIKAIAQRPLS